MSLKTWKAEFYPIDANSPKATATPIAAIEHSLRKWRGLTAENLKRHEIVKDGQSIESERGGRLVIADQSCSLCVEYRHVSPPDDDSYDLPACSTCPVVVATGRKCISAYHGWENDEATAAPMIALLERTLAHYQQKAAQS